MNLAHVPLWFWIVLGVAAFLYLRKNGSGASGLVQALESQLLGLQGWKTKIAAVILLVLAVNEIWHFLESHWVTALLFGGVALGLYGLRDALSVLEQRLLQRFDLLHQVVQTLTGSSDQSASTSQQQSAAVPQQPSSTGQ